MFVIRIEDLNTNDSWLYKENGRVIECVNEFQAAGVVYSLRERREYDDKRVSAEYRRDKVKR